MSFIVKGFDIPKDAVYFKLSFYDGTRENEYGVSGSLKPYIIQIPADVDLVRCGECKWSYTDERDGLKWCKVHMSHYRVNPDDFCSFGERRADERIAE